jgi:hypothetical protein
MARHGCRSPEDSATVAWLGVPFLAYVLSVDEAAIAARLERDVLLDEDHERALADVLDHARELAADHPFDSPTALPDGPPFVRMRRWGWTETERRQTHANLFRVATGGELPQMPPDLSPAEAAIADAAIDHYPQTLLPVPRDKAFLPPKPLVARTRVERLDLALHENPIGRLIKDDVIFYTSSGMGYGPINAYRVAECALATAEQRVRALNDRLPETFIAEAVANLRHMEQLVATGTTEVPVLSGFWNIEITAADELAGPSGGRIRAVRSTDPHIPMAAEATMVLETTCQVGLSIGRQPPSDAAFWRGVERLSVDEKLISLAGLLADSGPDAELALPMLAWTHIFDPFQPYVGTFKHEPPGPPTVPFPAHRLAMLEEWLARADQSYDPSIRVAVTRTLSAAADRQLSDDALIDYVIALENLFGGPGSALERRISNALASILAATEEEATEVRERSRRVYRARSRLVHGDELSEPDEHPADEARDLLLDALRALFTTHKHLAADRKARRRLGTRRAS